MTIKELKSQFSKELSGLYPSEELQSFFSLLSEFILNYSRLDTVVNAAEAISEENLSRFENAIERLKGYEPIQYIIGKTEFYGLPLTLNPNTLIPRPETEELVSWILEDQKQLWGGSILDIGTGSGCIAIALAKNLSKASVEALDVSPEALEVAAENTMNNKVSVEFYEMDILTTDHLPKNYDVIVSNPPYVRELEKEMMHTNVLKHEPPTALFVSNEEPLLFYRNIAMLALKHLSSSGKLYFEINEYLREELTDLLQNLGFSTIVARKDIFGKDRMLRCNV